MIITSQQNNLDENGMGAYQAVCGVCRARAHARTGDSAWISGYLGSDVLSDEAITDFAVAYANQAKRDYQASVAAVEAGKIVAQTGV